MLTVPEAEDLIWHLLPPLASEAESELIELRSACGRILAAHITSPSDFPAWDNSAMDGYAVRAADVSAATPMQPVSLRLSTEIPAGQAPQHTLAPGEAARIFTGAMLPAGADAVVMQEETVARADQVEFRAPATTGQCVRRRGSYCRTGDRLLAAGQRLQPQDLAVLASVQRTQVPVYRRLRVALFSTGNELVAPGTPLQAGQIVDSNQYALAALVEQSGPIAESKGIIPDDPDRIRRTIQTCFSADVILSTGGVSVGDYDYIDRILIEMGATLHVQSVAVKPGKPLTVATLPRPDQPRPLLYVGLPGNPVSTVVSFWRFVQPALLRLSGLAEGWQPRRVMGRTTAPLKGDRRRETCVWGQVKWVAEGYSFTPAGGQQLSGNLINLAGTNALACLPAGKLEVATGKPVSLQLV
jgi:molybdopterin molybdotransferase